ncbi:hypothetical protein O7627_24700 [Solwaraspora sp. WMMD1047]|uniref:coiled-coil domain-containing protein n=1 Tax=Solwaraspora sp. WMMD1047 TaxID=3016102 RepID=UPI002415D26A|nr:hypothetical protein [Solwaraspora sp. WMMD1047]MDG4832482.1 hypothetical protein [Solwaraspora sp. WMMD1047]
MPALASVRHAHARRAARPASRRNTRWAARLFAAVTVGLAATLVSTGTAVAAGPATPLAAPVLAQQDFDEGGSDSLRKALQEASKGFLDAQAALKKSTERQKQLTELLKQLETDLAEQNRKLGDLAGRAYRTGRLGPVSALLASDSPDSFLDRAATLDSVAANEDRQLRQLQETKEQQTRAKAAIDAEVAEEKKQVEVMAKRKQQAERALAAVGSGGPSGGVSGSNSARARAVARNSDGSFPNESCSLNDPTTSGCITPRTLNALKQAKAAGFTRFVSCFRSGGSGEHPQGKACDFAAQKNGFEGTATGGDRTYGNNLAAYFVNNASRLGVLYVIWFRQIWLPSSGWRAYNGDGTPSGDHTNHVHLSMN